MSSSPGFRAEPNILLEQREGFNQPRKNLNTEEVFVTIEQLLHEKREAIQRIAVQHGASNVRVFGSVARREAGPESDVDLLIDAGPTTSSWFPAGLILDMEELLGCRVDVVTENALHPDMRERVFREAVPL